MLFKNKSPRDPASNSRKKKLQIPEIFNIQNETNQTEQMVKPKFTFSFSKNPEMNSKTKSEFDHIVSLDNNKFCQSNKTANDKTPHEKGNEKGLSKIKQKLSLKVMIPDESVFEL
jgi:hypothetical protein